MSQDNSNNAMNPIFYSADSQVYHNGITNGNGSHFSTTHSSPALSGHSSPLQSQQQSYSSQHQTFGFPPTSSQVLSVQPSPSPVFPSQQDAICYHLYQVGFLNGQFSDILLHVPTFKGQTYRLHSIILARSPFLRQMLHTDPASKQIELTIEDSNITEEAFALAIGHLYAVYSQSLVNVTNARHVLAAAFFFQLDDLCALATDIIKKDISQHNVLLYTRFIEEERTHATQYGAYAQDIKEALFDYLTKGLVNDLEQAYNTTEPDATKAHNAQATLIQIYSQLSFETLKRCIDTVRLSSAGQASEMVRYQFAKEVVALREKQKKARGQGSDIMGGEESVVLAFGGAKRVQLVRKPFKQQGIKTKTLWKVPQ